MLPLGAHVAASTSCSSSSVSAGFLRELAVIVPAYLVPGAGIIAGKALLIGLREDTERSRARERRAGAAQTALRQVATAVAAGAPAERLYELVSRELAELVNASGTGVVRYESATEAIVLGSWARRAGGRYEPGTRLPIRPGRASPTSCCALSNDEGLFFQPPLGVFSCACDVLDGIGCADSSESTPGSLEWRQFAEHVPSGRARGGIQ